MFFFKDGSIGDGTMGFDWGKTSLKLSDIFNGGLGIGSQLISAYGKNPSSQVGYSNSRGIFEITPSNQLAPGGGYNLNAANPYTPPPRGVAEDLFGSITDFISKNPLPVAGLAFGAYLLMKEPPKRR